MLIVALGVCLSTCITSKSKRHASSHPRPRLEAAPLLAAEWGLLPWDLAAPISRLVVLPGPGNQLVLLGGLNAADNSTNGVFTLDTTTGMLHSMGNLHAPVHDAVGAVADGQDLVLGGGSPATVGTVQAFPQPGSGSTTSPSISAGTVVSNLPNPRSDAASATIGDETYIVGGYDGSLPDAGVLSTTNGQTFEAVASLPVPVRYPAVAVLGTKLYVFGGQAITGPGAGEPVDDIQVVDPANRKAWVAGRLPEPLSGGLAMNINGSIYVAGGESSVPQPSTPGLGTTQIGSPRSGSSPGAGASGAITDAYSTQGVTGTSTVGTIWAFDPSSDKLLVAGRLQVPVSHAGVAVLGQRAWIVGGESNGVIEPVVQMITPNGTYGTAGAAGAGSPYFGAKLLVADRGNDRLLVMNSSMHVDWTYPSVSAPSDPLGFYFPDDAFFMDKGAAIISNQEENETIVEIAYPSGKIIWSYGHPKQAGSSRGFLHEPDDAYLLPNGQISVADARELPSARTQLQWHRRSSDRHDRTMRTRPAGVDGFAQRRHPTRRRQPSRVRDQRIMDKRIHDQRSPGLDDSPAD